MEDPIITTPRSPRQSISDLDRADDWSCRSDRASLASGANLWVTGDLEFKMGNQVQADDGQGLYSIRPVAMPIPWAYDDAGADYPADTMLVLTGSSGPRWDIFPAFTWTGPQIIPTLTLGSGNPYSAQRHFTGRWYVALRVPEGSVGTITLKRSSDWGTLDTSVTLGTATTVAATESGEVWVRLPDASAPADNFPYFNTVFYLESSWSGGNPEFETVSTMEGGAIYSGTIVPQTLPAGYTLRQLGPMGDLGNTWRVPSVPPPFGALHYDFVAPSRLRGKTLAYAGAPFLSSEGFPCTWIGDELKEHRILPACYSRAVELAVPQIVFSTDIADGPVNEVSGWALVDQAAGWRDIRAWIRGEDTASVTLTITMEFAHTVSWAVGSPTVTVATLTFPHADLGANAPQSTGPIDPGLSPGAVGALYVRVVVTSAADTYDLDYTGWVLPSRRADLPWPWPVPATDGTVVEGGTLAAALADPVDTQEYHETAGTSQALTLSKRALVRFAELPYTGLWAITDGGGTVYLTAAQGDRDFRQTSTGGALGIGGKAFFAHEQTAFGPYTMVLSNVPIVQKVIASGGTSLSLADVTYTLGASSFRTFVFGTIAIPSAGTYRLWMRGYINSSVIGDARLGLWASLTDPYCYETIDQQYTTGALRVGTVTARTDTPPGAPALGSTYIVGDSPTGIWADKAGQIAVYDSQRHRWRYLEVPQSLRIVGTVGAGGLFRDDAGDWHTETDNYLEVDIAVPGAQTIYVRMGRDDPSFINGNESAINQWLGVSMGWEAV